MSGDLSINLFILRDNQQQSAFKCCLRIKHDMQIEIETFFVCQSDSNQEICTNSHEGCEGRHMVLRNFLIPRTSTQDSHQHQQQNDE